MPLYLGYIMYNVVKIKQEGFAMSDSFYRPYFNPRTQNWTYGASACMGRIKTHGGMDNIKRKIIEDAVEITTQRLLTEADLDQTGTN